MNKEIQDLFTQEEWQTLSDDFLPELRQIAALPLIEKEDES